MLLEQLKYSQMTSNYPVMFCVISARTSMKQKWRSPLSRHISERTLFKISGKTSNNISAKSPGKISKFFQSNSSRYSLEISPLNVSPLQVSLKKVIMQKSLAELLQDFSVISVDIFRFFLEDFLKKSLQDNLIEYQKESLQSLEE